MNEGIYLKYAEKSEEKDPWGDARDKKPALLCCKTLSGTKIYYTVQFNGHDTKKIHYCSMLGFQVKTLMNINF